MNSCARILRIYVTQLHLKDLEIFKKKVFSFHTKKANRGRRCTAPLILSIGTRLRGVATSCLGCFTPWIKLGSGEPQNWSGGFGEDKNRLLIPGYECQTIQPEASPVYYA